MRTLHAFLIIFLPGINSVPAQTVTSNKQHPGNLADYLSLSGPHKRLREIKGEENAKTQ